MLFVNYLNIIHRFEYIFFFIIIVITISFDYLIFFSGGFELWSFQSSPVFHFDWFISGVFLLLSCVVYLVSNFWKQIPRCWKIRNVIIYIFIYLFFVWYWDDFSLSLSFLFFSFLSFFSVLHFLREKERKREREREREQKRERKVTGLHAMGRNVSQKFPPTCSSYHSVMFFFIVIFIYISLYKHHSGKKGEGGGGGGGGRGFILMEVWKFRRIKRHPREKEGREREGGRAKKRSNWGGRREGGGDWPPRDTTWFQWLAKCYKKRQEKKARKTWGEGGEFE